MTTNRILELVPLDYVSVNGKLARLHEPNEECRRILKSLEGAGTSTYVEKFYAILAECLPDLSHDEVMSLNFDQALAVQQRLVAMMARNVPNSPER